MDLSYSYLPDDLDLSKPQFDIGSTRLTSVDAVKCLTGEYNVVIPLPNARPCNNLDEYLHKSTINVRRTPKNDLNQTSTSKSSTTKKPVKVPFAVPLVRNFEKILKKSNPFSGDSPNNAPSRPKRAKTDIFTKTEQIGSDSGPMLLLKKRLNQQLKVLIRRRKKVPYISRVIEYRGKLVLFDKHMNLYLQDVVEMFKYEKDGKVFSRGRHRDAIILRGDNIILVA